MCAVIAQYIYAQKGVHVVVKPVVDSQRELFLLEYAYNYIAQKQGIYVI
jgi:hypothetical protein